MRSAQVSRVMAQGFQACRLQRTVQGFFTELSTDMRVLDRMFELWKKARKIIHKGKLIKK